ncbi:MAG: hypothetical protein DRZ79_05695 [Candidatus Cloacimonadota bacterium]|nr:MAG: hypothetical protein DRZ79_05695 [Candidatus Cloacimonadota bacterium]
MYCSIEDIVKRLSEKELIILSSESGEQIDETVVNTAIEDAGDIIDSYLKKAYALPLETVPKIILKIATELAIIYLNDKNTQNDESIEVRRKNVFTLLDKIAKKEIVLNLPAADEEAQTKKILYSTKKRLFKRGF